MLAGAAGPPVHSESIVPNEKGGFEAVTMDRGRFSSLSGERLTLADGTKSVTYKSVTLTIPSDAQVYSNGEKAQLSDIKSGDAVTVVQSPRRTFVNANDAEHEPNPLVHIEAHKVGPGGGPPLLRVGPQCDLKIAPGEGPPPHGAPEGSSGSEGSERSSGSEDSEGGSPR
jgi:hypothetical protein